MQGMTPLHAASGSAAKVVMMLGGSSYAEAQTGVVARGQVPAETLFLVTDAGCKGSQRL